MKFIRKEEPYSGYVIRTEEKGKSYRVAPTFPWEPEKIVLCELQAGMGWTPVRELNAEEKKEYFEFVHSFEEE